MGGVVAVYGTVNGPHGLRRGALREGRDPVKGHGGIQGVGQEHNERSAGIERRHALLPVRGAEVTGNDQLVPVGGVPHG